MVLAALVVWQPRGYVRGSRILLATPAGAGC